MFDEFIKTLQKEIYPRQLLTSPEALITYSTDSTGLSNLPKAVFLPESSYQLQSVIRLCNQFGIQVTARGSGTGLSGGAIPRDNSLVVCLARMNRIISIDEAKYLATVEPGVVTAKLRKQVERQNLFYPPDPSSASVSTIGGNIATAAGGPRIIKYGTTSEYVLGLEAILLDGSLIRTGILNKENARELDHRIQLTVGSRDYSGLITKAVLKLITKPSKCISYLVAFKRLEEANQLVIKINQSAIMPAALEIMDKALIEIVTSYMSVNVNSETNALLLIEIDDEDIDHQEQFINKELVKLKPLTIVKSTNQADSERTWSARRAVLPLLSKAAPSVLSKKVSVPPSKVANLIRGAQKIAKKYKQTIACFGQAAIGNINPTIVTNLNQEINVQKTRQVLSDISDLTQRLGGSLSGQHGMGLVKKEFLKPEINKSS